MPELKIGKMINNTSNSVSRTSRLPSLYNKTYTPKNDQLIQAKRGSSLFSKLIDIKKFNFEHEK